MFQFIFKKDNELKILLDVPKSQSQRLPLADPDKPKFAIRIQINILCKNWLFQGAEAMS